MRNRNYCSWEQRLDRRSMRSRLRGTAPRMLPHPPAVHGSSACFGPHSTAARLCGRSGCLPPRAQAAWPPPACTGDCGSASAASAGAGGQGCWAVQVGNYGGACYTAHAWLWLVWQSGKRHRTVLALCPDNSIPCMGCTCGRPGGMAWHFIACRSYHDRGPAPRDLIEQYSSSLSQDTSAARQNNNSVTSACLPFKAALRPVGQHSTAQHRPRGTG